MCLSCLTFKYRTYNLCWRNAQNVVEITTKDDIIFTKYERTEV